MRAGVTNGSRSPSTETCCRLNRANWASALALENALDTCAPHGRHAPLAVSGSVSYTARTTSGARLLQDSCTVSPIVLSDSGNSVSGSFHSSAARPVTNIT
ncbi:hypothetical protein AUC69_15700 [Methyloceanibacter superfactus]|uniref:Uncharacterized protein n=1 Tax=Methyloceanibacter superfactus TaxID=1774969 RepID=A0A1E3VRP1_9HYPH|nr:hypothetical protein AUC69_15700 [Methyloceanibacter superfactus]